MNNFRLHLMWAGFLAICLLGACHSSKSVSTTTLPEPEVETSTQVLPELPTTPPIKALRTDTMSLLWEISGNGLTQNSYLFGTIHLIEKNDFFLPDVARDRFKHSQQLTLELDMDDPSMMMAALSGILMNDGVSLKELLTEEEYKKLAIYFSDSVGMDLMMFDRMKPILLSTMMSEETLSGEMISYEGKFMEMAQNRDMEILGLETAQYQMSMFDSIPYADQAKMLMESLEGEGSMSEAMFNEMINLYKAQDLEALGATITQESSDLADFETLLLVNRNKNWVPLFDKMSREMPTFFAVGAGHLPGEYGMLELLRKEGFTLVPLKDMPE